MTMQVQTGSENEILRTVSKPIRLITSEIKALASEMIKTMNEEEGVGLAAPQVGRNIRLIICKLNHGEQNEAILAMVNPKIIRVSEKIVNGEEGCLSLPGQWGKVKRAQSILLTYLNLKNEAQTLELSDFNARVVQHEIDHLDGVLFTDKAVEIHEVDEENFVHI